MGHFKNNLNTLLASSERNKAEQLISSSCAKIKGKFEAILSNVERFIEVKITHKHDESSIKEFADSCRKWFEELQRFEEFKGWQAP